MKRIVTHLVSLVVVIAAVGLLVRILGNDERNNWFALIPGTILALVVGLRVATVVSRR